MKSLLFITQDIDIKEEKWEGMYIIARHYRHMLT